MTQEIIYPNGTKTVSVPIGEYIKIGAYEGKADIYLGVAATNAPATYSFSQEIENTEVTLGPYSVVKSVQITAGAGKIYYDIGASPSISFPTPPVQETIGAMTLKAGPGAASATSTTATASAAATLQSQAGGANTGGASGGAGGAAGSVAITGGAGGATNSTGAHAAGAGADVNITAGVGGAATAGTGNGGAGGTIILTPGAGGATTGGTAGAAGVIIKRGIELVKQGAATAKTVSATLTAAEILAGEITVNQGAGAASAQQLCTAAALDTALPDSAVGDGFDFSVTNISTTAAEDASITTNTGWTLVGNMDVASNAAATDKSAGLFRAKKTAAGAWTLTRRS